MTVVCATVAAVEVACETCTVLVLSCLVTDVVLGETACEPPVLLAWVEGVGLA